MRSPNSNMMTMGRKVGVVAGACIALAGASREAWAAGFATQHFGGEQGSVVTTNPTALYYNPGALGFSEGIHLFVDGDIALRHATWSHVAPVPGQSEQPDSQVGNTGTASLFNVFAGPSLAASFKFGNLALGVGLFVPFGGRVNWGSSDSTNLKYPLTAGGVQRWHMVDAALTFLQISAGAAYKLGPLSIGVAGNFINSQITETQGRTIPGNIDSTSEGRAGIDVAGNNGSFAAGAMLEIVPDHLWVAGSYQAQPGLGEQKLQGTFTIASGPPPQYAQNGTLTHDVYFHQSLPDIIRGGIRFRASSDFELRLFGDLTRWSKLTAQCINYVVGGDPCQVHPDGSDATPTNAVVTNIPRNWKDTFGGHLGASYWIKPEIELFAGVGYETGAAPDETMEPGAMDANNYSGSIGGRFLIANYVYLAASYTHLQFANRTVTTSTLAEVTKGNAVSLPTFQQDGNGDYTQWVGFFDINLEKQF